MKVIFPEFPQEDNETVGFIKFRLSPKTSLPAGTVINNRANVWKTGGSPEWTNNVFHTIGEEFVPVALISGELMTYSDTDISISPNPFRGYTSIVIDEDGNYNYELILYDLSGKPIRQQSFDNKKINFSANDLPKGVYFLKIMRDHILISSRKLVIL